jgi:glyoxylase-like metal-dependent hydrolase (beta-lactamase superfamily II)
MIEEARLPVPFVTGGAVNAFVLPGPPTVLVDPGPDTAEARSALVAALGRLNLTVTDLDVVIVTHAHVDHAGAAAPLAVEAGAALAAHPYARDALADWPAVWAARLAHYERAAQAGGVPAHVVAAFLDGAADRAAYGRGHPAASFRALADGATVVAGARRWRVIHTPGHAVDHIALYQPESATLISGDLLLRHLPTVPFLDPRRTGPQRRPALADLIAAWRAVGRLNVAIAWPGHGAPIRAHRILVARRLATTRTRLRAARAAVAAGAETVWEVAAALGSPPTPAHLAATVSDAAGLLEWLVDRGLIERAWLAGVVRYKAPPR